MVKIVFELADHLLGNLDKKTAGEVGQGEMATEERTRFTRRREKVSHPHCHIKLRIIERWGEWTYAEATKRGEKV